MSSTLHFGRWQEKLEGELFHSVIGDPPYGPRTHGGYRTAKDGDEGAIARKQKGITYKPLTRHDVRDFVRFVDGNAFCRWVVLFGDDVTSAWWKRAFERRAGWYAFAPLPWVKRGATPRFTGDGPASQSEWITVAGRDAVIDAEVDRIVIARRTGVADGARKGWYETGRVEGNTNGSLIVGQKPLTLMRALVREYSRPGDIVADPWAGSGTTGVACAHEGRGFVGTEELAEHHAIATKRLARPTALDMFAGAA